MRPIHPVRIHLIVSLTVIALSLLIHAENIPSDPQVQEGVEDVCFPLAEARSILKELQPGPVAHLESKIGGNVGSFGSKGWGDAMGWGHEGPVSTALRLLPRLLNTLSPTTLLSRIPFISSKTSKRKAVKVTNSRKAKVEKMLGLMTEAEEGGCDQVWGMRGSLRMFPPKGVKQDLPAAFAAYTRHLETTSDPESQFMIGLFHATGLGGIPENQGRALLYYMFAALQGYRPAEMALGYRHWAGIGVKEDCLTAMDFYEDAAKQAYGHFLSGSPGGRTLPLAPTRLSDRIGGIYGPHASWASTGANANRAAVKASSAVARGETEKEVLEYYQYHSDRDAHVYTVRLGRLFYLGSVYFLPGGISSGAERVGEIPQSYTKAKEYFLKVAKVLWPVDFEANGQAAPRRKMTKEMEETVRDPAMVAAAFLGRMAMRGEGQAPNYKRARMWYERAVELGDKEAHNGLGIMYRDGLGVPVDKVKAYHFFQAAAGQDLAEAQVHLGKLHLERGEIQQAVQLFEVALRHGSTFEAFHLLSHIHATTARLPLHQGGRPGMCGVSVAWYKLVAEKGSWEDDFIGEADRAWDRGEEDKAMLGWWIAGEMGYEAAQNNVAFLLDRGLGEGILGEKTASEMGLRHWVRSAAQDNVDAIVKVGDLYYAGIGTSEEEKFSRAATYYQTAADKQTSAMAYWNLGRLHEMGQGVPRDWHLAKRFYDLSLETSTEAYLPVMLSLAGLYLRSWWMEMRTAGEVPGLRFLEGEDDDLKSSARHRIRSIFSTPPEYDAEALDTGEGGYDDLSGAGWTAEDGGLEEEDIDDLGEILIIVGIGCFIMGLLWLRGRWAVWAEERRLREAADRDRVGRGQEGVDGVQVAVQREGLNGEVGVGGVVPEPIINAPIP